MTHTPENDAPRFYRLDRTDGGPLPDHPHLKVGAIIRIDGRTSTFPGDQWNAETKCWVSPIWVECEDPTRVIPPVVGQP